MIRKLLCALCALAFCFSPRPGEGGVILALSGGGTKGFAHLGVMEALE